MRERLYKISSFLNKRKRGKREGLKKRRRWRRKRRTRRGIEGKTEGEQ